jgi:D-serine deaminase-like pyridoxal phosphate-dependent protein
LPDVPSPALLVDLDAFEANVTAAAKMLEGTSIRLRPHIKTHRCPSLARRQLIRGTIGVTCATLAEAELMVDAGIGDVLIANEIVAHSHLDVVARLASRARVAVAVDSLAPLQELSRCCTELSAQVDVLVDVDVGLGRCGVRDPEAAAVLARKVVASPGVHLRGLMGYEGRLRRSNPQRTARVELARTRLSQTKAHLEGVGLTVPVVSGGGTSTLRDALSNHTLTEIQAGTYAFMEADLCGLGLPFTPAVSVLATTISGSGNRCVVDAGWKALGCHYGDPVPIGVAAKVVKIGEEHTVLRLHCSRDASPGVGDRLLLRPSHVGMTFALHNRVWLIRAGRVETCVPAGVYAHGGSW